MFKRKRKKPSKGGERKTEKEQRFLAEAPFRVLFMSIQRVSLSFIPYMLFSGLKRNAQDIVPLMGGIVPNINLELGLVEILYTSICLLLSSPSRPIMAGMP